MKKKSISLNALTCLVVVVLHPVTFTYYYDIKGQQSNQSKVADVRTQCIMMTVINFYSTCVLGIGRHLKSPWARASYM